MICVPIVGPTMDRARKDLDACQKLADIIELRLDLIEDFDLPSILHRLVTMQGLPASFSNNGRSKSSIRSRRNSMMSASFWRIS